MPETKRKPMKSAPPKTPSTKQTQEEKTKEEEELANFISSASSITNDTNTTTETKSKPEKRKQVQAWDQPGVRDDVLKVYNLRLPEPYLLKLKHIADNTPKSMQKFCLDALLPAIDKEIKKLSE